MALTIWQVFWNNHTHRKRKWCNSTKIWSEKKLVNFWQILATFDLCVAHHNPSKELCSPAVLVQWFCVLSFHALSIKKHYLFVRKCLWTMGHGALNTFIKKLLDTTQQDIEVNISYLIIYLKSMFPQSSTFSKTIFNFLVRFPVILL